MVPSYSIEGTLMLVDHDMCMHPDGKWPEYDAQGIFLCYVCSDCVDHKLSKFRPEILTGYTQADVDEPIEPDDW